GSIGYNLYINDQFQGFTTETSLSKLVGDGKNTWRVDTLYAGCPAVRSGDFTFTAGSATPCGTPGNFQITAPAAGSTVTSPVNAAWGAVSGATSYRVFASLDGGDPEIVARTTNTAATLSLPSGGIELFIEALTDGCGSLFTPHLKFTVSKAATCDTHRPVTLVSPSGGAQAATDVTFKWTATDAAALYRVWLSMNGEPFESIGVTTGTQLEQKKLDSG